MAASVVGTRDTVQARHESRDVPDAHRWVDMRRDLRAVALVAGELAADRRRCPTQRRTDPTQRVTAREPSGDLLAFRERQRSRPALMRGWDVPAGLLMTV